MTENLPKARELAQSYVDAFVRNSPLLCLTGEERMELWRLFHLALQARTIP